MTRFKLFSALILGALVLSACAAWQIALSRLLKGLPHPPCTCGRARMSRPIRSHVRVVSQGVV